ncbi:MAG: thiamine phosphate synthase [Oscillospiraceae bacterium]|nr:thiamine phosphate synthase [Oscillospiraceae bacterium]
MCKILCVTNRHLCRGDYFRQIERIAQAHPDGIIVREKDLPEAAYAVLLSRVAEICQKHSVPVVAHTFPHIAAKTGVDALHLPLGVLRELDAEARQQFRLLGASCHSAADAQEAVRLGANYVTAGHIFETDCKKGLPGRGLDFLREVCATVSVPVYAIGGISPENTPDVLKAGAAGVCIMSGFMQSEDPSALAAAFRK